jgi:hypothetical protein
MHVKRNNKIDRAADQLVQAKIFQPISRARVNRTPSVACEWRGSLT